MLIGDAFFLDERSAERHMWVVVIDPHFDPERVVAVSLTTDDVDPTCALGRGKHPFLTAAKTYVNYRKATVAADADWELLRGTGRLKMQEPVSDEVLNKIIAGALASEDRMPIACFEAVRDQEWGED